MYERARKIAAIIRPRWLGLVPVLVLAALVLLYPPDGQDRSQWMQFAGRFHLLTIHFPIALIYLVPLLELAGRHPRLPHLKASVEFFLVLALLGSLVAAALGWSLGRSGGYSGHLVTQHMWGGVLVAAACWACWMLRARVAHPYGMAVYAAMLAVTVALVSWTGYRGGQMTQGENHLTDAMPAGLRTLFGVKAPPAVEVVDPNTFYGARVVPVLAAHCYSCHGQGSQRGGLRLDSYAGMMHGGKNGRVLVPGNAAGSEIYRRITLPRSDERAMPPSSKPALTSEEIKVLELWIASGASTTMPVSGIHNAPKVDAGPVEITFPSIDTAAAAKARAKEAEAVAELQTRYPNILQYEARDSAALTLNASLMGAKFGDADLGAFKRVADEIVSADFSDTDIGDRSAPTIAAMERLRMLRAMHTRITDATLSQLTGLTKLESLNVLGDKVTASSLKSVEAMPRLRHMYVAGTEIPPSAATEPRWKGKLIF